MTDITILNGGAEYKYRVAQSYVQIFNGYIKGNKLILSIVGTGSVLLLDPTVPIILKEVE